MSLLLTAAHVVANEFENSLFIVRKMVRLANGTVSMLPDPIQVTIVAGCPDPCVDVAVLKCPHHTFSRAITMCPASELPSTDNEDRVKSYHCPIQLYLDCNIEAITCVGTDYEKLRMSTSHHYWLPGEHVHGSSGGVIVDKLGRAVGMIVAGYVVGSSSSLQTLFPYVQMLDPRWEKLSALSDGTSAYTKGVILITIIDLSPFLLHN
jgi:hypothetical protein